MTEPRPPSSAARAASARQVGQSAAGSVVGAASHEAAGAPPAVRWDRKWRPAAYRLHAEEAGSTGKPVAEGASTGKGLLGGGVPGRDGEPQDVAERPGIPLRRGTRSGQQARDEHGLGRDHPAQRGQPTLVLGLGPALEDESVEVLAGEAHLDPHPGCAASTSDSGDGVLERPVEVGQPGVDIHRRHRIDGGGGLGRRPSGRSGQPRADQLELLGRLCLTHASNLSGAADGQDPAQSLAALSRASTRLVRSHVKAFLTPSACVRPKWP